MHAASTRTPTSNIAWSKSAHCHTPNSATHLHSSKPPLLTCITFKLLLRILNCQQALCNWNQGHAFSLVSIAVGTMTGSPPAAGGPAGGTMTGSPPAASDLAATASHSSSSCGSSASTLTSPSGSPAFTSPSSGKPPAQRSSSRFRRSSPIFTSLFLTSSK